MWAPLVNFQLTLFCLIFTSELWKGLIMFELLSALWIFEKKKTLSVNYTGAIFQYIQENKTMRMTWDLFGRQHFSFGLRSNVLWVEDQTVWSPHLDRLHHQPSRPIWSVKDLIKELFHSHCISGIMRPLKTLSVCTFLPNRNDLSEVILADSFLSKKWLCGTLQSTFFDIGTFSPVQNWLIQKNVLFTTIIASDRRKIVLDEKKRCNRDNWDYCFKAMIGHICRHLLQNSCFTFICKLIHIYNYCYK